MTRNWPQLRVYPAHRRKPTQHLRQQWVGNWRNISTYTRDCKPLLLRKPLAAKPDSQSSVTRTHMVEDRLNSPKLSSDTHMHIRNRLMQKKKIHQEVILTGSIFSVSKMKAEVSLKKHISSWQCEARDEVGEIIWKQEDGKQSYAP